MMLALAVVGTLAGKIRQGVNFALLCGGLAFIDGGASAVIGGVEWPGGLRMACGVILMICGLRLRGPAASWAQGEPDA